MKQRSMLRRIKNLFGWKGGRRLDLSDISEPSVDADMEKVMRKMKKVPYVESEEYNLKYDLTNLCESNSFTDLHEITNAVDKKPNADVIVNTVLSEISRTSKYSQDIQIRFKMKSGWEGYIKLWLYPKIYYGKPSEYITDFSEIYLVEKDPSFSNWVSIFYSDTTDDDYRPTYDICLDTVGMWDRHCSHYSGIWSVSWVEFLKKHKGNI